jgi:hypothetical protein
LVVDGTDFRIATGYQGFLVIQIQKKWPGMKLLCASKQVIFAGGLGHMHLGYGMMVLYSRMG